MKPLLALLEEVEAFYGSIGGIVGYHAQMLKLIKGDEASNASEYSAPQGIDLCDETPEVKEAIRWGLEALPYMAEIYPIGGAGDRLGLHDEQTGEPLPACVLRFGGVSLLHGLIRDLQAREHLYEELFGEKVITPIALMTSVEKKNHERVLEILERNRWFGRPKESFKIFTQGMVPVLTKEGNWCMCAPLELVTKPGGHGVLWRQMQHEGVFDWLAEQGRTKALIRQINNPAAGLDHMLLSFAGIGAHGDYDFGFAACHRRVGSAEGTNVLFHRGSSWGLTNIEYTEFAKHGLVDEGDEYSLYPANTNVLFADLKAVEAVIEKVPLPGMLINMKKTMPFIDADGKRSEELAGRLETMMQNIADYFTGDDPDDLPSFLTFNKRSKTISVTKNTYRGEKLRETPPGCYFTMLRNWQELFGERCGMELAPIPSEEEYVKGSIPYHINFHPRLGPLWSIIAQKVRGGRVAEGAELQLNIAQVDLVDLDLDGSLRIMGRDGTCRMKGCKVRNAGLGENPLDAYWHHQVDRDESLLVDIHPGGEFVAENVTFEGNFHIEVFPEQRVVARQEGDNVILEKTKISEPSWNWEYTLSSEGDIVLNSSA